MVEIIVTIALEVAKCLAPSAGRQISYLREHKTNFKNLKAEVEKLKQKHTSIQHRVDEAERNGEVIENFVQNWLERASKLINEEAPKFTEDEETAAKKRCLKGLCPDLKIRHQLSKQAVKQLDDLAGILKEAECFGTISYRFIPKDPRLSNENYESFESRMSTLTDVIDSLRNPDVNIVGIYGMGGVGKTTLAKEVAKEVERIKLFDLVAFAEVSHIPNLNRVQGEIADALGLTLTDKNETDSGRAAELSQRLKKETKILIILDNIWDRLDLHEVGIPIGEGRKLLLTARSLDVLLAQMDSKQNFRVDVLNDDAAWSLFKKMAGDYIERSELKPVATEVAKKCAGLPLAIVTVARAMRNKDLFAWKDALQQLGVPSSKDIQGVHASVELSYNHLKSEILKKTILLIGYANITSVDALLMYGSGLGLFERTNSMEGRHVRLLTLVQQLKDSCLLLESNTTGEDFSMHDVVREATISIASRDRHVFANELVDEWEWPDLNTLKVYPSIVLKDVKTGELPQVLECQQLKLLSVSAAVSDSSFEIHDELFTRMMELKVLVLENMYLWSLPSSLSFLTNLRALGLHECKVIDIAIIGDLKKLEILSLKNSFIKHLPVEIGRLTQLKFLDLRGHLKLEVIPANVISSLSHLQELYMGRFDSWEEQRPNKERKYASLDELKMLTRLTSLQILVTNAESLPEDLSFKNLERYHIDLIGAMYLGCSWDWRIDLSYRRLQLSYMNKNICLNDGHIMQLKGIEDLRLSGLEDIKNVVHGLDKDGFQQLKYLQLSHNPNLLCIVDSKNYLTGNAFPRLESLDLSYLDSLEKICGGQVTAESFSQLRLIKVESCGKLENIFSFSIARRLEKLRSIEVRGCENMGEIFAIEREDESNNKIELSQLRSLKLNFLQKLRSFCSTSQQRKDEIISNPLFSGKVVLPSLEVLELSYLELIDLIWENQFAAVSSNIKNLTRLIIRGCKNLRRLFSSPVASSFVQLQHLEIEDCADLEEIVVVDGRNDVVFPQLQFLRMERLYNLTKFCSGDCMEFPLLKELKIEECPKLKEFLVRNSTSTHLTEISLSFFNNVYTQVSLPRLETLIMTQIDRRKCDEVKSLFGGGNMDHLVHLELESCEKLVNIVTSSTSFKNLTILKVHGCKRLINILTSSTTKGLLRLREIEISTCNIIEEIMAVDREDDAKDNEIIFSELKVLKLFNLQSLRSFCSANCTLKFPSLVELNVHRCSSMDSILTSSTVKSLDRLRKIGIWRCHLITEIVIADKGDEAKDCEIDFGELKQLELSRMPSLTSICSANCILKFPSLVELNVHRCSSMESILTSSTVKSLDRLRKIGIWRCHSITEIVAADKGDEAKDCEIVFGELKELELSWMPSLTSICSANCTLKFPSLIELSVFGCPNMKSIFTSSTAKSLERLRQMKIWKCNMITEIVAADKGDEAKDYEIIFSQLKVLDLDDLHSLTSFCSNNYTLKFPSLEELTVEKCPEIKSFSKGELSTPKLRKVKRSFRDNAGCWTDDLNTTIQQLRQEKKVKSSKEDSGQPSTQQLHLVE